MQLLDRHSVQSFLNGLYLNTQHQWILNFVILRLTWANNEKTTTLGFLKFPTFTTIHTSLVVIDRWTDQSITSFCGLTAVQDHSKFSLFHCYDYWNMLFTIELCLLGLHIHSTSVQLFLAWRNLVIYHCFTFMSNIILPDCQLFALCKIVFLIPYLFRT